jgi:FtsP/CotA-like multicopper oxidase with cupredoxin domain
MRPVGHAPSRRSFIRGTGAAVSVALFPVCSRAQPAGSRVITARTGTATLRGGDAGPTPVRGFDGTVPGPLLRVKRGEELSVRLVNELVTDVSIHWHGVRVPNAMDGVPGLTQAAVAPGDSFQYRFMPPDAGTYWYSAPSRFIEDRALYGVLIVDETERVDVDRDVALVLGRSPRPRRDHALHRQRAPEHRSPDQHQRAAAAAATQCVARSSAHRADRSSCRSSGGNRRPASRAVSFAR